MVTYVTFPRSGDERPTGSSCGLLGAGRHRGLCSGVPSPLHGLGLGARGPRRPWASTPHLETRHLRPQASSRCHTQLGAREKPALGGGRGHGSASRPGEEREPGSGGQGRVWDPGDGREFSVPLWSPSAAFVKV